ncbi:hypothetical protein ABK040_015335 [Willaertia magna]
MGCGSFSHIVSHEVKPSSFSKGGRDEQYKDPHYIAPPISTIIEHNSKTSTKSTIIENKTTTIVKTNGKNSKTKKSSRLVLKELSLIMINTNDLTSNPILSFIKEKEKSAKTILDSLYDIMCKQLYFGINPSFPVNNENYYDIAIDFIAQGCQVSQQRFTLFAHREMLIHRSAFFKSEISKDLAPKDFDMMKRTTSNAHFKNFNGDYEQSVRLKRLGSMTPSVNQQSSVVTTVLGGRNSSPVRNSLPQPGFKNRPINATSSSNLLASVSYTPSSSSSDVESNTGSTSSLESSQEEEEENKERKLHRTPCDKNLSISISKQQKNFQQNQRIEVQLSPAVVDPSVILIVFENIYSGYFRPSFVTKVKSLDLKTLIQVYALGYQFKVPSLRSIAIGAIGQIVLQCKDKYSSMEEMIEKLCSPLTKELLDKANIKILLHLKDIFKDCKKSIQENFIALGQEKKIISKDLDFMYVHSNSRKNHMDYSDLKVVVHIEDKENGDETDTITTVSISDRNDNLVKKAKEEEDVKPLVKQNREPLNIDKITTKKIFVHQFLITGRSGLHTVEPFYLYNSNIDILKCFIHYLYTDSLHRDIYNISKKKLIPLAAAFNMDRLKYHCLRYPLKRINEDNILRRYRKALECRDTTLSNAILYTMAYMYPILIHKNYEENSEEYTILFSIEERVRRIYQRLSGQFCFRRSMFLEHRLGDLVQIDEKTHYVIKVGVIGKKGSGVSTFYGSAISIIKSIQSLEGVENISVEIFNAYFSDKHSCSNVCSTCDGIIFLFDVGDIDSYENAKSKYIDTLKTNSGKSVLFVGNKCDTIAQNFETEELMVDADTLETEMVGEFQTPYFEITALNKSHVKNCCEEIVREVIYYKCNQGQQ